MKDFLQRVFSAVANRVLDLGMTARVCLSIGKSMDVYPGIHAESFALFEQKFFSIGEFY
jgi:hypothetical protein